MADGQEDNMWVYGLVGLSGVIYIISFVSIVFMYIHFDCEASSIIISLTLVLTLVATVIQLFGTSNGSLLTSAILTGYSVFLCFSAISLNPDQDCNPTIGGSSQTLTRILGTIFVLVSLSWTTRTTVNKAKELSEQGGNGPPSANPMLDKDEEGDTGRGRTESEDPEKKERAAWSPKLRNLLVEVAIIFLLVSCYYSMVVTNWATEQNSSGETANKTAGWVAMWLQASAQWIAIGMYIWSLVAPTLFPDRDFS